MARWFPGVPRFVLISRLAVCVQSERTTTHCSIWEQITPLQHATLAHTRRGWLAGAAANTSFLILSTNTTCKITHSRDCRSRNANLRARLRRICGLAAFAPVRSHRAKWICFGAIVCLCSLHAQANKLLAYTSYFRTSKRIVTDIQN